MKLVSPLSPSGFTFLMSSAAIRMFFLFVIFVWVAGSRPYLSHPQAIYKRLSKSQRLRHLKAKAKGAEDAEEHACTGFNAAILYARDI